MPSVLRLGPVLDRRFDDDGRIVLFPEGGLRGWWTGHRHAGRYEHAAVLALVLDVLDPAVDVRVGVPHVFTWADTGVDDPHEPTAGAYGAETQLRLDWMVLRAGACSGDDRPLETVLIRDELSFHPSQVGCSPFVLLEGTGALTRGRPPERRRGVRRALERQRRDAAAGRAQALPEAGVDDLSRV